MDELDFEGLSRLLNNGFPLRQAFQLLESNQNKNVFACILKNLDEGQALPDFFASFCPNKARPYLQGFLHILPFSDALMLCTTLMKQREEEQKKLVSSLAYPLLMFLVTTLGIFVFKSKVYPSLASMMEDFNVDSNSGFLLVLIDVYLILVLVISIFLLLSAVLCKGAYQLHIYQKLFKVHPDNVYTRLLSLRFAHLLLPCLHMGLGTLEWVKVLSGLRNGLLFQSFMDTLQMKLENGVSLADAITSCPLDPLLLRTIQIASYSSQMEKMLKEYVDLAQMKLKASMKRLTMFLQLTSYTLIGFVLVLIYQILMLPMFVLTQF